MTQIVITPEDETRFWSHVAIGSESECWTFVGASHPFGYGCFNLNGKTRIAHRIASQIAEGRPIPDGICVLHRCDNPPCCNPAHLFRGTRVDNNADMRAKNRHSNPPRNNVKGERNGHAKLSEHAVISIRERRAAGERVGNLAAEFGVNHSLISMVVARKRWAWL